MKDVIIYNKETKEIVFVLYNVITINSFLIDSEYKVVAVEDADAHIKSNGKGFYYQEHAKKDNIIYI